VGGIDDVPSTAHLILNDCWGLPEMEKKSGSPTPAEEAYKNLKAAVDQFLKKYSPQEKLEMVISYTTDDPFEAQISYPVVLSVSKSGEQDLRDILKNAGAFLSTFTSLGADSEYKIASEQRGDWKLLFMETPFFIDLDLLIAYNSDAVLFLRGMENFNKFFIADADDIKIPKGAARCSRLYLKRSADSFAKFVKSVENSGDWRSSSGKKFFTENVMSIFKTLAHLEEIQWTDRVERNKLVRTVIYKVGK